MIFGFGVLRTFVAILFDMVGATFAMKQPSSAFIEQQLNGYFCDLKSQSN